MNYLFIPALESDAKPLNLSQMKFRMRPIQPKRTTVKTIIPSCCQTPKLHEYGGNSI